MLNVEISLNNDYELIKVKENRIGNYDIGNGTEELRTADGKIYINNITEGTYKLKGSDNKEISFEITSDGVSSNIRINKKAPVRVPVMQSIAEANIVLTPEMAACYLSFVRFGIIDHLKIYTIDNLAGLVNIHDKQVAFSC